MKFTRQQLDAIQYVDGNLQLIACAGSGKTEFVARHVAHLLHAKGGKLAPRKIIAFTFTFTDKAAAELKQRIAQRCREELGDVVGLAEIDPEEYKLQFESLPFPIRSYKRIAVKVVDVYGNESTVVRDLV